MYGDRLDVLVLISVLLPGCPILFPLQVSSWLCTFVGMGTLIFGPVTVIMMLTLAPKLQPASYVFGAMVLHPEVCRIMIWCFVGYKARFGEIWRTA